MIYYDPKKKRSLIVLAEHEYPLENNYYSKKIIHINESLILRRTEVLLNRLLQLIHLKMAMNQIN